MGFTDTVATPRELKFTVKSFKLLQDTTHTFTISKVITPSNIQGIADVAFNTQDSQEKAIDGVSDMKTTATSTGSLSGTQTFTMANTRNTPGFASVATVSFTVNGRIEIGGKIELVLPDSTADSAVAVQQTWQAEDNNGVVSTDGTSNVPAVAFTSPNTNAAASVSYTKATRTLTFTTQTSVINQGTAIEFTITNVRTPSSVTVDTGGTAVQQNVKGRTLDSTGGVIDGGTAGNNIACEAIVAGTITGTPTFVSTASITPAGTKTPGFESVHTVTFKTAGEVPIDGFVKITMPDLGTNVQA